MKILDDEAASGFTGNASSCATNIAFSASFGGLFGGVGAVIGGVAAATGPACLGWWS